MKGAKEDEKNKIAKTRGKKSKSGTKATRKKSRNLSQDQTIDTTIEMPTVDKKEKKKKEPWSGEEAAKRHVSAGIFNQDVISGEFAVLANPIPNTDCDRFLTNASKNRLPGANIRNEKLVTLKHAPNYISAARVTVQEYKKPVLVGESPGCPEDFWRMMFHEEVLSMLLCLGMNEGPVPMAQFLPTVQGSTLQCGKMFLNNRKTDTSTPGVTQFTIEVLPDGCSNSTIVSVYHLHSWQQGKALDGSAAQPLGELVSALEKIVKGQEVAAFISFKGTGRAGTALALFAMMVLIQKEKDQKVKETLEKLRVERCGLVDNLEQYQMIHKSLAMWFKSKASDETVVKKAGDYVLNLV